MTILMLHKVVVRDKNMPIAIAGNIVMTKIYRFDIRLQKNKTLVLLVQCLFVFFFCDKIRCSEEYVACDINAKYTS